MQQFDDPSSAIQVDILAIGIPARRFRIRATLAYDSSVPLVDEFVLRLLRIAGDIEIDTLRQFFGFSEREVYVLLSELAERGLVEVRESSVQLASLGRAAFVGDEDAEQRIVAVEETNTTVAFDRVVSTPLEKTTHGRTAPRGTITLPFDDRTTAAQPSEQAANSFKKHFAEIAADYLPKRQSLQRAYVYSVDEVVAKKTFVYELELPVILNRKNGLTSSFDFSKLHERGTRGSRDKLIALISQLTQSLSGTKLDTRAALDFVAEFDCGALSQYFSNLADPGLCALKWIEIIRASRSSDFVRHNVPFIGAPSLGAVRELLAQTTAIEPGEEGGHAFIYWVRPSLPGWGRSSAFSNALQQIKSNWKADIALVLLATAEDEIADKDLKRSFYAGSSQDRPFDCALRLMTGAIPGAVEIIFRPGHWVIAIVYVLLDVNSPRVPVGFASHDASVVSLFAAALAARVSPFTRTCRTIGGLGDLSAKQTSEILDRDIASWTIAAPKTI